MKIRLLAITVCFVYIETESTIPDCNGVTIDGVYHEKELLKDNLDRPYLLATNYRTNTVYFSYSLDKKDDNFQTSYIRIKDKEFGNITDIPNGFAQTIDQEKQILYVGTSNGIYKYDILTKESEFYGAKDVDIWTLYFKDVLYYSNFPNQYLYTIVDDESEKFLELQDTRVDKFLIDNENEMFFINDTGLYSKKSGSDEAVLYHLGRSFRALTTNKQGDVYICLEDGIYIVDKKDKRIVKIVDLNDAFGLTFDDNNLIIYADATSIVKLQPKVDYVCKEPKIVIDEVDTTSKEPEIILKADV